MSIFYNIFLDNTNLSFLEDHSLVDLSFYFSSDSYTKVTFIETNILYDTSIFISVNCHSENCNYKSQLLSLINLLFQKSSSFLLTFNGDLPLIFFKGGKKYIDKIPHFSDLEIIEFIQVDMGRLIFERNVPRPKAG